MIDIIDPIFEYLSGNAALAAQVSDRIYPRGEAPHRAELPYIGFFRVGNEPIKHQGGVTGKSSVRLQFDVWAGTKDDAEAAARPLYLAMIAAQGTTIGTGNVRVRAVVPENAFDEDADPSDGSDRGRVRVIHEYTVTYDHAVS